jgi:hypothetical protein
MDPADLEAKACVELGFCDWIPRRTIRKRPRRRRGGKGGGIMEGMVVSPTAPRNEDGRF